MQIICDDTKEVFYNYNDYLKSRHWAKLKIRYQKEFTSKTCQMCFDNHKIELHHMTYERIGKEDLKDLIYLCDKCHKLIHKEMGGFDLGKIYLIERERNRNKKIKMQCRLQGHYKKEPLFSPEERERIKEHNEQILLKREKRKKYYVMLNGEIHEVV
jgi:hypothetical protein